jgi:hypothetical protein
LAIEDASRLQKERDDLARAKFELVTRGDASTEAYDKLTQQMVSRHLDKVGTVALALGLCVRHWAGSYLVLA